MRKVFSYINLKIKTGSLSLYFLLLGLSSLFLLMISIYLFANPEWAEVIFFGILAWPFFPFIGTPLLKYCYPTLFALVFACYIPLIFKKKWDILMALRYVIGYFIIVLFITFSSFALYMVLASIF